MPDAILWGLKGWQSDNIRRAPSYCRYIVYNWFIHVAIHGKNTRYNDKPYCVVYPHITPYEINPSIRHIICTIRKGKNKRTAPGFQPDISVKRGLRYQGAWTDLMRHHKVASLFYLGNPRYNRWHLPTFLPSNMIIILEVMV